MNMKQHKPMHPGEFIQRVYLEPFELGIREVAKALNVSPSTLSRLVNGKSDIVPNMALKISKVLGRSPESWMQMQDNCSLFQAKHKTDLSGCEPINFEAA